VVHDGQRLALVGESGEYLGGIHAEFDYFEGQVAANGLALLNQVHRAHAAFAQRSKDVIPAEIVITGFRRRDIEGLSFRLAGAN
jgi:hypothetical protein